MDGATTPENRGHIAVLDGLRLCRELLAKVATLNVPVPAGDEQAEMASLIETAHSFYRCLAIIAEEPLTKLYAHQDVADDGLDVRRVGHVGGPIIEHVDDRLSRGRRDLGSVLFEGLRDVLAELLGCPLIDR